MGCDFGLDHRVGHFWPLSMTAEFSNAPFLRCLGAFTSHRGSWGGRRHDRGLKIGWKWVHYALSRCYELISSVYLSREPDPEPAIASTKQAQKRQLRFAFEYAEV